MRDAGLTLVETLVAIALLAVVSLFPILLFVPSMQTNNTAKQRTLALRAAETWLDRYRANQEPMLAVPGLCTVSGSVVTCTYPYNYSYSSSDWSTHDAQLASIMSPFRHVVTLRVLASGANVWEYEVSAQTFWKQGSQEKSTTLTTRMAF
ncbi:type IV pilus modification PilV family protein [Deinococcus metallilatus]|nr:type II secretion system protein [Deinococcus metallilatus]TLK32122.1 type II secretion system protein [Deinococcus metallilatus]GMA15366.1 hypothetical protein GCM10025871_16970 [Deinococcus metallilatus]